jgi:hypothetical protein
VLPRISIAQHDQRARTALSDIHRAVVGDGEHARIFETFRKAMNREACRHLQLLDAFVRRRNRLRLIDVAGDGHVGEGVRLLCSDARADECEYR